MSSGEDESSLCEDYYAALSVDSQVPNVHYKIGTGIDDGWHLSKVLDLQVVGLDSLREEHPDCYDLIYI